MIYYAFWQGFLFFCIVQSKQVINDKTTPALRRKQCQHYSFDCSLNFICMYDYFIANAPHFSLCHSELAGVLKPEIKAPTM